MAGTFQLTGPASVVRNADGACIPFAPGNADYQAYQAWLGAGNSPDPVVAPLPPTSISSGAFLSRFTSVEELAIQGAALGNSSIALGLTMGLAKGAINLLGDGTVTNWMQSLVSAGALTQARMTEILTP